MEENTFNFPTYQPNEDLEGANVVERFLMPGIAEVGEMQRENYMVDKANAFNEYMYEKALQDNSAAAQMQRAKEAGINLNLAAGGVMGNGNAIATPMQSAQGNLGMNTNTESPFRMANDSANTLRSIIEGSSELGKLFGFGKENKANINLLNKNADKAAEEANFTYWQKRQYRRTMRLMYDQAQANLDQTEANVKNLQKLYEVYEQQKYNIAEDTTLKGAQTGEVKENTKNLQYKNWEEQFKKAFRDLYGVQLNESDLSMLVQAILGGKGKVIIDSITNGIADIAKQLKESIKENAKDLFNPFDEETTEKLKAIWEKAPKYIKKKYGDFKGFLKANIKQLKKGGKTALESMGYWQ